MFFHILVRIEILGYLHIPIICCFRLVDRKYPKYNSLCYCTLSLHSVHIFKGAFLKLSVFFSCTEPQIYTSVALTSFILICIMKVFA